MTFGVGTADFPALQRMALQNGSAYGVSQSPDINAGLFLNVRDVNNVRNQITSYFRHFFSTETANNPVWTVPYLDNWGLGVVISGTLPVTQAGEVLGVAVVDMTLTELLEESTFFQPSEYSYSFIIDRSGLVINHPLFPEVEDTHPLFVEATAYEREEEFLEVFESMKSGFSGNKTFLATRLYSGDMSSPVMTLATYFWKPIDGTPFVTCVVIPNGDKRVFNPSTNLNPIPSFLYHRFDIVPPEYQCVHFNFYLCSNQSSIALSARSFKRVEEFLLTEETENSVTELKNYMEGRGGQPTNLEDDIRDVVKLTLRAESLWINSTQDKNLQLQVVLFRYIGTREGVFRLYPGSQEPKDFDPVTREWYRNALLNRGKYAVTPPYEDVDAGLTVVTISKVIYQGRTDGIHTPNDTVVGVMGLDIVLSYFNDLIVNLYPLCGESNYRCLLIDNAGYVIWSDQVSSLNAINLHLSFPGGGSIPTVEPQIMNALIRDGLAVVKRCANIDDATLERKYEIIAHEQTTVTTNGGISASCFQFTLTPIRETNSFLIVREDGGSQGDCNQLDNTCRRCSPNGICVAALSVTDNTICECPCRTSNLDYNACTNQYQNSYPQIFPCSPTNQARLSNFTMGSVSGLPKCFAVVDSPSPSTPKGTDNIGLIAGCVVAGVVLVVFVVTAVVLFRKKKSKNEHKNKNELKYQNENSTQAPAPSSQTVGIQKVDVASYENPLGEHSENDVYDEYITMEEQNNYRNIII
ncbi:unnamed protein product [Clavelina lepadiformis]|uniref:Uncharacterized protein n=1 Tax=Clavelina lepadiformis TaxID=159417 RepID=A0ABP0FYZ8_CLALP